jgi:hypothetical protein
MTKTIEIIVGPKGETVVTTRGFTGGSCREASRYLEEALGKRTAERLTAEFHQNLHTQQDAQERA